MFNQSVADCLFVPEGQGYVDRRAALDEYINSYKILSLLKLMNCVNLKIY